MDRCHRVYRSRLEWVSGLGLNWVKTIQILLNVGKSKRWKVFFWREWSILLNTDHIFLFLTPSTDSKAGILVPLRRNWSDYFQFLCSFVSNWNFFSTRGSRCCDTTKWKWICTGVPNGFALVCSEWKSKSAKNKRSASSTKLTNKHRENQWQFVSWIILTWWNFWYCMLVLALQCSNLLMEYQLLNATRSKSVNKWIWASLTCLVLGGAGDVIPENLISQPIQLIRDQSTNSTDQRFIGAIILQDHQQYRSTAITDIADIGHQSFSKKIIFNFTYCNKYLQQVKIIGICLIIVITSLS